MLDRLAAELGGDRLGALEVQVGEQDAVAVGRQPSRDRLTEPLRRAGDDRRPGHD